MTAMSRFAPLDAQVLARGRNGAGERNRTPDRLITNQLLYLLSYASYKTCVGTKKGRPDGVRIIPSGGLIVKRLGQPQPETFHDQIGAVCGH